MNTFNPLNLRSQYIRSATTLELADTNGFVTTDYVKYLILNPIEDCGLYITGHSFVESYGKFSTNQLGSHTDDTINGLTQLSSAIKSLGAKAILQLSHSGDFKKGSYVETADEDEIKALQNKFVDAAERAYKSGFHGIQIHAAHGFCISQFLSPYYNNRTDAYGGTQLKRFKLLVDIIKNIRKKTPKSFLVITKVNISDFVKEGLHGGSEIIELCKAIKKAGGDAVEFSGGTADSEENFQTLRTNYNGPYYSDLLSKIKKFINIPVIIVGGIRTKRDVELILKGNIAEYIAVSRPLFCEPDLFKKWIYEKSYTAYCISCNRCCESLSEMKGPKCVLKKYK